jgi:3-oxoacyl-[acyl-carrier-protein] synthase-3
MATPSTASLVQERLGATRAGAYDLSCACAGFVYALSQVAAQAHAGLLRAALVVGAETLSRFVDWDDRDTAVLFGDGAGAVVVEADALPRASLLAFELGSDGSGALDLHLPARCGRSLQMNGAAVFRFAGRTIVESTRRVLDHSGLQTQDVDWFVTHQANQRILDYAVTKLGIPPQRVLHNLDRYGNTSAASIPLVLAEAAQTGKLRAGDRVLMVGYGAGLAWGSCLMEWGSSTTRNGGSR